MLFLLNRYEKQVGDHRANYHRRGVVHNLKECHYYTTTEAGYFDGYAFLAGVRYGLSIRLFIQQ